MRDAYDTWLILRAMAEDEMIEHAITYGILEPYLCAEFDDYRVGNYEDWVLPFIEEGRTQQRYEFTAEELFIWAHEYDVQEFGLKNMWPFPYIKDRVRIGA